jgi:hypothetical protein
MTSADRHENSIAEMCRPDSTEYGPAADRDRARA